MSVDTNLQVAYFASALISQKVLEDADGHPRQHVCGLCGSYPTCDPGARRFGGEASVKELAEPFEMTLPVVSKHLKVLERAGLISRGRVAQSRSCRLEAAPLREVSDWVEQYRGFWEQSFDRLDEYLRELRRGENEDG